MEKICPSVGGMGKNTSQGLPVLPTRETHQSPFSSLTPQPIQEELEERREGSWPQIRSLPTFYTLPFHIPWWLPSRTGIMLDPGEVGRNVSLT